MKKEVRAGETVIIKENGLFFEKGTELIIDEVTEEKIYLKQDENHSIIFQLLIKDFDKYLEIKQPKDPNKLIGRKVKGFRFENEPKLSCAYTYEMDNYINLIGEIKKYDVDSYKVRFEDNYFWYPADQIETHLLPEKKTKKQRIEELESEVKLLISRVEFLEKRYLNISEKQAPEFWYVDIQEEKDSELLPKFKEWFVDKSGWNWDFNHNPFDNLFFGFSGCEENNGFEPKYEDWYSNSDKMQKITLNEWNHWFNK